ncbi:MAG: ABC transporter ATP-binding protein [Candidatus Ozemobacter sibiricus]|jgi:ATP-binding cassette subfamily C protein|uniref:ABC transporter ATP-binding protein n=1 Tax=Candidatus Ozemobacter sibiricus TaxID=2268124 RepID=A0A367Z8H5_9BACT|nr:MAG: ABC transporter ATP-binding protein [Candidatus Ozemobacter sibiricus]
MTDSLHTFIASLPPGEAERFAAGGNTHILLNGKDQVWFVESGRVDLFLARRGEDGREGRRLHLARLEQGACLFGRPTAGGAAHGARAGAAASPRSSTGEAPAAPDGGPGGTDLVAVGTLNTELVAIPRARFLAWLAGPVPGREREALLQPWIDELTAGLVPGLPPLATVHFEAGRRFKVEEHAIGRCQVACWCPIPPGPSTWLGYQVAPPGPDRFFPLSRHGWITAGAEADLQPLGLDQPLAAPVVAAALDHLFDRALEAGNHLIEEESRRFATRRLEREAELEALNGINQAFIQGRLGTDQDALLEAGRSPEPLFQAVQAVGRALGVPIPFLKPSPLGKTLHEGRLSEITAHCRLRVRRVVLTGSWWEQECGPILAALEETKAPVALLPEAGGRYRMIHPETGKVQRVDEAVAATLTPFGFTFYRSFPLQVASFWAAFRFAMQGTGMDAFQIALMTLLTSLLGLLTPYITGIFFDRAIPESNPSLLLEGFLCLLVSAVVTVVWQYAAVFPRVRLETQVGQVTQAGVIDRLLALPTAFFRQWSTGDLAMRALSINAIRQELGMSTLSGIQAIVTALIQLGMMAYYCWDLILWVIGLALGNLIIMVGLNWLSIRSLRQQQELSARQSSFVLQSILGIAKLKVAGAEARAFRSWSETYGQEKRLGYQVAMWQNALAIFQAIFPTLANGVIFYKGASLIEAAAHGPAMGAPAAATFTLGGFMAFLSAAGMFTNALSTVGSSFLAYVGALPEIERMTPLFTTKPEIQELKSDPGELSGRLEVSRLSFRYTSDGPLILNEVSFQVKPGEFVAVVGPSGSGKSTLMRLLLGFEAPESGSVQYDGKNLNDLAISAVRRQIGVVMQAGRLNAGSMFQLIAGAGTHTLDEAWEAAALAGLKEDIEAMPMQMHTMIGDGGTTLSGGQRQRLLIARALIKKPRLIFFDEATSALDNRTQAIVSDSLNKLRATRVVIAHRLSTIQGADRIVVLQRGQVAEIGSFAELMARNGLFATLAKRQLA